MENLHLLTFLNNSNQKFVYSGNSGLVLKYGNRIENYICGIKDEELEIYLADDPFYAKSETYDYERPYIDEITLLIANQCNANCLCSDKKKINESGNNAKMDQNTLKNCIDFILSNFEYNKNIKIIFSGDEPLLNFSLIKNSIDMFKRLEKEKNIIFSFSIITNGTILNNEIKEFLIIENFTVIVNIDETDIMRNMLHDNNESFMVIAENIKILSEDMDIKARLTLTDFDANLVEVYENLENLGVRDVKVNLISHKVHTLYADQSFTSLSEQLRLFSDYYIENIKKKRFIRFNNLNRILSSIHFGAKKDPKFFPCNAGKSGYSFSIDGNIYLCHHFNNCENQKWGNIYKGFDNEKRKEFIKKHIIFERNDSNCANCWARYLCGGTCYHSSLRSNNETSKVSSYECRFNQELIKSALYIYTSLENNEKVIIENMCNYL